ALEPLVAPDRDLAQRAAVRELAGATLDLVAGDLRCVEHAGAPRAPQPRRPEALADLEALLQQLRAAHPIDAERSLAVARDVVRVHVPVRQSALERVRLDGPGRRLRVDLLLVLDFHKAMLIAAACERCDQVLFLRTVRLCTLPELE